jgi:hypothetical protein
MPEDRSGLLNIYSDQTITIRKFILLLTLCAIIPLVSCVKSGHLAAKAAYIDPHCPAIRVGQFTFRGDVIHDTHTAEIIGRAIVGDFSKQYEPGVWSEAEVIEG